MNDFTKEELEKAAQTFIIITHNLEQEQRFKSGGIAFSKVKNYEEYLQLEQLLNICEHLGS